MAIKVTFPGGQYKEFENLVDWKDKDGFFYCVDGDHVEMAIFNKNAVMYMEKIH